MLLKYGYKWLLMPTGGSPVMVHLINMCLIFLSAILTPLHGVSLNKWKVNFGLNTLRGFWDQNLVRLRKLRMFNFQQSQKHLYFVQKWLREVVSKMFTPSRNRKDDHNFCIILWTFSLLLELLWFQKVTPKLKRHHLSNG